MMKIIPSTIDSFTLQDAIAVKNIFLNHNDLKYNITYDSAIIDEETIIEKIEAELKRFEVSSISIYDIDDNDYKQYLKYPVNKEVLVDSKSEQAMTSITINSVDNTLVTSATTKYLSMLATDTSLNDIIRIKNGLTYGIYFYTSHFSYKPYITFACDVTKGNEDKLLKLFKESINLTANNFTKEKYDKYIQTTKLKRTISNLNLTAYEIWFYFDYMQSKDLDPVRDILATNIDDAYKFVDSQIITFEKMNEDIQKIKTLVNENKFAKVFT